jgi:glycosyltransferase involved in cell wall biosynthesis
MKILWIPHTSWENIRSRDQYFIEALKDRHEIHVIQWHQPKGPRLKYFLGLKLHTDSLKKWHKKIDKVHIHHYRRLHNNRYLPCLLLINNYFFKKMIKRVVKEFRIDVVIVADSYYLNGFPPFDLSVPIIFDFLDYNPKEEISKTYVRNSNAVLCVSKVLLQKSLEINAKSYYLPNPIFLDRFSDVDLYVIRNKFDLKDKIVVGLIGITCSETLFFLDALPLLKEKIPNISYLIVGDSYLIPKMKEKAKEFSKDVVFTGWIKYNEIANIFSAIDVGINPVDRSIYYDSSCSIKVLEYTAAKKPVVSTYTKELETWNFSNVFFCESNAKDFAEKVLLALNSEIQYPSLANFDIKTITEKLEEIIGELRDGQARNT